MRLRVQGLTAGRGAVLALALLATAGPASARTEVAPYIELDQTFIANLKGGGNDFLTYTSVAAGADVRVETQRSDAQVALRYEHQFGWNRHSADQDIFSGLARGSYAVLPGKLSLEAGGIATRTRIGSFTGANGALAAAGDNTRSVYSLFAGPSFTTRVGEATVKAAYRFGYTHVDDNWGRSGIGLDGFDSSGNSTSHSLNASVGMQPGALPFGWSVGGGYEREAIDALDQRYVDKWVRGDLTVPVSSTLALVGGAGYEKMQISQRRVAIDADGKPEVDDKGRYVLDKSAPRLMSYDTDGFIWDAGVLWRPSRRTSLEARVGRRYGSMHYIGSFRWQASPESLVQIAYFDTIDSLGRSMNGGLAGLSTGFTGWTNPFSNELTGCVTGTSGGTCFNDALAAINASNYRHRGVSALYSYTGRRWNWGAGLGASQRKFLAPDVGVLASINGLKDYYYYAQLFGMMRLDPYSSLSGSLYANYSDRGRGGVDVANYGAYLSYGRLFGRRLMGRASLGVDAVDGDSIDQIIALLGQVGVRYTF